METRPLDVSLVAVPEAMVSSLGGMFDVFNVLARLGSLDDAVPGASPFRPELVGATAEPLQTASGLPVTPGRAVADVARTDLVIVPSLLVDGGRWVRGRYPELVDWMTAMHDGGALLCSACSGVLLIAETGLLDGREATLHWAYARTFRDNFPEVTLRLGEVLLTGGERQQFIMSGASSSWHDLVLYLIARHAGPAAAQAISNFMLLQWHEDGQAPYVVFEPVTDHGDAIVLAAQRWLAKRYSVGSPVEEMVRRSGLPERSFKRRFRKATGLTPIEYAQRVRVEEAKRRLERTNQPVDEIAFAVGYEDPAFFRRLFKRVTRMTPGAYRKKLRLPAYLNALHDPGTVAARR